MDSNATPQDSASYEWGRYRGAYPRSTARHDSIKNQIASWEADDPQVRDDDPYAPYIKPAAMRLGKSPDHSNVQKRVKKVQHKHEWQDAGEISQIIQRPYSLRYLRYGYYDAFNSSVNLYQHYYSKTFIQDPVMLLAHKEICSCCSQQRVINHRIRELAVHERSNFETRREIEVKRLESLKKREQMLLVKDDLPKTNRKKKTKKSGRKRK